MSQVYCNAPWTSTCCMPDGKYTPCCAWHGPHFDSPEEIIEKLGPIFKNNQAPQSCQGACPSDRIGWRQHYAEYATDYQSSKIYFLDFRNSNLCNMKCRSCGPVFSSSWSQELNKTEILKQQQIEFNNMDLTQCQRIYFAGGEPLLNYQHYELLQHLISHKIAPALTYSTNLSSLHYKDQHVGELWKHFPVVYVNVSLDAVGKYAEFVRSGTNWDVIENNIAWAKKQPNVVLVFSPVISAINVWWIDQLFNFISKNIDQDLQFQPVLAATSGQAQASGSESITVIPIQWREPLIESFESCKNKHATITTAIDLLKNVDHSDRWLKFISKQMAIDLYRNESWFANLPIKDELYCQLVD